MILLTPIPGARSPQWWGHTAGNTGDLLEAQGDLA